MFFVRLKDLIFVLVSMFYLQDCANNVMLNDDKKYYLVSEAYDLAKDLFNQGRNNYDNLKIKSLEAVDTFLDLVQIMNNEMAKELRSAIVQFYKIKYFHDFTNYVISMEEIIDITEHCLIEPKTKLEEMRSQFHDVIKNFEDVRNFNAVDRCKEELPDEVAAAHCILHQAVLFNETMQQSLLKIVQIKTTQHAQDMNTSLYEVQNCFNNFVPKFFEQLLIEAYTDNCGYMKTVNASMNDLIKDTMRNNQTTFPHKWGPVVKLLKQRYSSHLALQDPMFVALHTANLTSQDLVNYLY